MSAQITKDLDIRPSSVALWFGSIAPPICWAVDLQLRYALVHWACANRSGWVLTVISAPLIIIALAGAAIGWKYVNAEHPRIRFMALGALALGLIFALTIIAGTLPDFFFTPCD